MTISAFQSYLIDGPCSIDFLKSKMKSAESAEIEKWYRGNSLPNIDQIHELAEITVVSPIEIYAVYLMSKHVKCVDQLLLETLKIFELSPYYSPLLKSIYFEHTRNNRLKAE